MRVLAPLLVIAGVVAFAISARGGTPATAIAPCLPHANTAQESQMLSMVIAWRAQNVAGAGALAFSGPLNAAAAGYAQYLIDHPGASGHYADGSDWSSRAQQCGFASNVQPLYAMLKQSKARVEVKWRIRSSKNTTGKARKPAGPYVVHGEIC